MKNNSRFVSALFAGILSLLAVAAFLSLSPLTSSMLHRDSGIFLSIGWQLTHGKVLYLQTWDDKQPLIFLINALGLIIGNGSVWGVWVLECLFIVATVLLTYILLQRILPSFASFIVTSTSFLSIYLVMSGNFTEEYALFFQTAILFVFGIFYLPKKGKRSRGWASLLLGILTGLSFCLKQTYIDVAIAVALLAVFIAWVEGDHSIFINLIWVMVGFILVQGTLVGYFFFNGALKSYWESAFLFNKYYSTLGLLEWFHSALETLEFTFSKPVFFLAGLIWMAGFLTLIVKISPWIKKFIQTRFAKWLTLTFGVLFLSLFGYSLWQGQNSTFGLLKVSTLVLGVACTYFSLFLFGRKKFNINSFIQEVRFEFGKMNWHELSLEILLIIGLMDLPIVLLFISLSGMGFPHYFISLYYSVFLLLAVGGLFVGKKLLGTEKNQIFTSIVVGLFVCANFVPLLQVITSLNNAKNDSTSTGDIAKVASYLKNNSNLNDKVQVWGCEAIIYFLAERESPTRFGFPFIAYYDTPFAESAQAEIYHAIVSTPPKFIAEIKDENLPLVNGMSIEKCLRDYPSPKPNLDGIRNFVCSNYKLVKTIGAVDVYEFKK